MTLSAGICDRCGVIARGVAAGVVLCLIAAPASAEWKRVDSPNFVVFGDVGAGDLRNIARKFEAFREMLSLVFTRQATATPVPTIVVVFPSDNAFTPFRPLYNGKPVPMSGLFMPRQDANYIAIVRNREDSGLRIVFHEYAHLLISNVASAVPVWLNEGLAEFYSTFEVTPDGREALIGQPVPEHIDHLNGTTLLPLDELLQVQRNSPLYNEGERRSVLYAQSWALTHLILLGQPSRREHLGRYLDRVAEGAPEMDAWRQAFGDDIERELKQYIERDALLAFRLKFADKLAAFDAPVTSLPRPDSEALLASLLVHQQRYDEAANRLNKLSQGATDPGWVTVVRALLDASQNDYDAAAKRLSGLAGSNDWLLAYLAGSTLADVIDSRGGTPDTAIYEAVRSFFGTAAKSQREIPNVLARTATLDLANGKAPPYQTIASIQRAMKLAPGRTDYQFLYARALAQQGSYAASANVLRRLTIPGYPQHVRDAARRLLEEVQHIAKEEAAEAARRNAAAAAQPAQEPDTSPTPPAATEPNYRQLAPGEERLEGVLLRIDCARSGATFHVETSDGVVLTQAPKMQEVEFISYRDDLTGNITCGTLKRPMPVYLTWRPGADGKGRLAIAVEFVAK